MAEVVVEVGDEAGRENEVAVTCDKGRFMIPPRLYAMDCVRLQY